MRISSVETAVGNPFPSIADGRYAVAVGSACYGSWQQYGEDNPIA